MAVPALLGDAALYSVRLGATGYAARGVFGQALLHSGPETREKIGRHSCEPRAHARAATNGIPVVLEVVKIRFT